jgi:hypothetical protein
MDDDLSLIAEMDARIARIHARLGYQEASRTRGEDGLICIKLARIDTEES